MSFCLALCPPGSYNFCKIVISFFYDLMVFFRKLGCVSPWHYHLCTYPLVNTLVNSISWLILKSVSLNIVICIYCMNLNVVSFSKSSYRNYIYIRLLFLGCWNTIFYFYLFIVLALDSIRKFLFSTDYPSAVHWEKQSLYLRLCK